MTNEEISCKELFIKPEDAGQRLDQHLSSSDLGLSRSYVQKLVKDGQVKVNDKPSKASYRLKKDDRITIFIPPPKKLEVKPENIPLRIIYEDDDLIVVNKPSGMVVHPAAGNFSGTLVNALLFHCKNLSGIGGVLRPGIVHRLDKNTSGLLVVAKNDRAHLSLSKQIKERTIKRRYVALVHGRMERDEGIIEARMGRHPVHRKKMAVIEKSELKSKEAITHYKVSERFKNYTLVEVELKTGRTHQIRVHMSSIGHPVVGDSTYGRAGNEFGVKRQLLHAKVLGFVHPVTGEHIEFKAELPEDFRRVLDSLSGRTS